MTINTADLTTESVALGTGVFDVLMRTVKAHLKEEFDSNRIKGNDYAQAYVTLMATAMQVSIQYAVSKPESDAKILDMETMRPSILATSVANQAKTEQEVQLLWEKTMTERANTQEMILGGYKADGNYLPADAIPVLGVIGKQKTLYTNQAEGYTKDHKVKVAKLYADIAAVQLSSNDVYSTAGNGLQDVNIHAVMSDLKNSM